MTGNRERIKVDETGLYKLVIVCDVEQQNKKRAVRKKGEEIEGNYTSKGDEEDESDGEQRSITRKKNRERGRE